MKKHFSATRVLAVLFALIMISAYVVPATAVTSYAYEYQAAWLDDIPDMLAAGEYEEGVVIAGIDMSKTAKSGDAASALEEESLRADTEELMGHSGICITSIRRDDMTTAQLLELLASEESIVFAEPNYITGKRLEEIDEPDPQEDTGSADNTKESPADGVSARDATPIQWSSSDDVSFTAYQSNGNVSMNVPGWPDGSNMDHEIIVAVLDYAVDFDNPDLTDRAYTFSPELQAQLGCDTHGFNATWESEDGKLVVNDSDDHGTHVAGIIGASWDGKGINGVGSNVRIVSVQIANEDGKTSLVNALRGMNFIKEAKQNGVDIRITNNSWGLGQSSKALDAAVTELGENGILTFFAAGNDGMDLNKIQDLAATLADNPYAIIVANSDASGSLSDSSNYGTGIVTFAAPGTDILSCIVAGKYIPLLSNENSFYEDFETDPSALKIYQIDAETGEKVEGTDGIITFSEDAMGFEGKHVMKVPINHAYDQEDWGDFFSTFRIDFSAVEGVDLHTTDHFGFAFGGQDETAVMNVSGYSESFFGLWAHRNSWNISASPMEEMELGEEPYITITLDADTVDEVYFDAIGIGSELHPYGFKSGTSMACPAAVGAAAVIASRHYDDLAAGDADSAKKLAGYVRSSVRPMPLLADKVNTGGIIDLTIDAKASDPAAQPAPDITQVEVNGMEVTLTGNGFGQDGGTVTTRKYIVGNESVEVNSEISAWNDTTVTISLGEDFEGILEVELTAANGKKDTIVQFVSKSSNLFETDHSTISDVGDAFQFDAPDEEHPDAVQIGDSESMGILMGLDGKIYYMPAVAEVEVEPAYKMLWCYDPDTDQWTDENLPDYPEWVKDATGTAYDGKLYVKGTLLAVDEKTNVPHLDEYAEEWYSVVYSYTPGDDSWQECSTDGVSAGLSLFSTDRGLMMAGEHIVKENPEDEYGLAEFSILEYDPSTGIGEKKGTLPVPMEVPPVVYAFGHICVADSARALFYVMSDDPSETDIITLPAPMMDEDLNPDYLDPQILQDIDPAIYSIAGDETQLIVSYTDVRNGKGDIFILKDGENTFSPYEKRVSDATLLGPASLVMDGRLYVLSSSTYEPDKRLFRSEQIAKQFTITYDLNGGSYNGSSSAITEVHLEGSVISIHEAPQREGYTFTYWKGSEYQPGDSYTVTEDHTFTAQWEKEGGNVPTGDESRLGIWITLAVLSAFVIMFLVIFYRRRSL